MKLALRNWEFRRWWWLTIEVRRWWRFVFARLLFGEFVTDKRFESTSNKRRFVVVVLVVETVDVEVIVNELNDVSTWNEDIWLTINWSFQWEKRMEKRESTEKKRFDYWIELHRNSSISSSCCCYCCFVLLFFMSTHRVKSTLT